MVASSDTNTCSHNPEDPATSGFDLGPVDPLSSDTHGAVNALQLALQEWTFTAEQATSIDQPVLYVLGADSLAIFHEGLGLARSWVPQAETALTPPDESSPADGKPGASRTSVGRVLPGSRYAVGVSASAALPPSGGRDVLLDL